nr:putative disease resistance protein [Quercus suber]
MKETMNSKNPIANYRRPEKELEVRIKSWSSREDGLSSVVKECHLIGFVDGFFGLVLLDIELSILAQGCRRLVRLELCGCEGSYDGIKAIGQCCQMLEELTLSDHKMDGGWLAAVSFYRNLKILKLQSWAALGVAFGGGFADFRVVVKNVVDRARMFKPILKRLESTLDRLAPTVIEIGRLSEQLTLPEVETKSLIEHMKKGENLVRKCSKIPWWNYLFKVYYSPKLKELEDEIVRFCQVDLQVHNTRNGLRTLETVISISKRMGPFRVVETPTGSSHGVAGRQDLKVGLDMPIKELKTLLLKKEVQLLLLTAPGGCGKTTLVKMLCQDEEIKGTFKENILFVTVSKTPNVKLIIQSLFNYKSLWLGFQFQSDEDAIDSLPQLLNHIGPDPILLILDDVWLGSESLLEKFKFDIPDYKILVTSRTAFPRFEFTYHLKPLNDEDAMTLFRHSASLKEGSSYIPPEEDIKKIVRGCAGFPLVLKVIGGSLCRQKAEVWYSRLMNWSDGQFFFNSDTVLLDKLQNSIEFPDDKVIFKNCFMDLGSFPEDQRIPAAAFIDMWAELYELDEDGIQAIANLQELTNRNLASLVMSRKDASEVNNYYNEDFVTQHDILRELAMYPARGLENKGKD